MPAISTPSRISEHIYVVYSEFPHVDSGNVFLITGAHPTLIDCGSPRTVPHLVQNIRQLGLDITDIEKVIATHGDYDHVQGFHGLRKLNPDLRLNIHRADLPTIQGENSYSSASYLYGQPYVRLDPEHCGILDDGDTVPADDTTFTVVHTPGHTEGSISLVGEIDGMNVLFAGDTVGGSMKSLEGADIDVWTDAVKAWRQSLRRLSTFAFDIVLNGHEPADTLPITRARFDHLVKHFGKMLNPWFSLGEPATADPSIVPPSAQSGA